MNGGFPSLSELGEAEGKHVLSNSPFPWRAEGMDAAAKAPFEEAWAAGEVITGTNSAKYTTGGVERQLCLAHWQSRYSTWSPQKLTPKSNTSFCIYFHRLMNKVSLGVERREYALMLLTSMCCNMERAIIAHPRAEEGYRISDFNSYCSSKGKSRVFNQNTDFLKVFFFT